jgi:hypothetical protein
VTCDATVGFVNEHLDMAAEGDRTREGHGIASTAKANHRHPLIAAVNLPKGGFVSLDVNVVANLGGTPEFTVLGLHCVCNLIKIHRASLQIRAAEPHDQLRAITIPQDTTTIVSTGPNRNFALIHDAIDRFRDRLNPVPLLAAHVGKQA